MSQYEGPISSITGAITGDPSDVTRPLEDFTPIGFEGGGLTGSLVDGQFQVTRGAGVTEQLTGLQSALSQRALEFANLRKGLRKDTAGLIGGLRERGVEAIRGRGRKAIGDLRETLQRRRVAGSSFAADALSRGEAEFAKEEADFGAQADVKQFELDQQVLAKEMELLDQETQANVAGFQAQLSQLNLESGLAAELSTSMNAVSAANAQAIADVMAQFAAARANIVGSIVGGATTGAIASDRRVKREIKEIGKMGLLPVYKFKYIWDDEDRVGFMAQDVEKQYPDCVINDDIKYINYTKLRAKIWH